MNRMPSSPDNASEFVRLLTDHQPAIRAFILSMLPGCGDVRDVLQDTNVVLWEKMTAFQPGTNFRAWAFTVARHKVMQHRDRMRRAKRLVFNEQLLDVIEEERVELPPDALERKLVALNQCLAALGVEDRRLVRLRYADGEPDAPAEVGRSAASIRVSLCRIRRKLRDCIEKRLRWKGLEA